MVVQRFEIYTCQLGKVSMKKILPLVVLLFLFIFSCSKTNTPISIEGAWELRHLEGGYRAPGSPTDFATGNGNIWTFTNNIYQSRINGQLSGTGSFTTTKDYSMATGRKMDAIILNGNVNDKLFFEIKNNILTMYRGIIAADGTVETYEKIDR